MQQNLRRWFPKARIEMQTNKAKEGRRSECLRHDDQVRMLLDGRPRPSWVIGRKFGLSAKAEGPRTPGRAAAAAGRRQGRQRQW